MNSIKKLLALVLALVMIFSLTCGSFAYAMDDGEVIEEAAAEDVIEEAAEELVEEPVEEPAPVELVEEPAEEPAPAAEASEEPVEEPAIAEPIESAKGEDLDAEEEATFNADEEHVHDESWTNYNGKQHIGTFATAWTASDSLPTRSGSYYLTTDVTLNATWDAPGGTHLCLNGHTISAGGLDINVIQARSGYVYIHDCVGTGTITGGKNGIFIVGGNRDAVNVELHGGIITGNSEFGVAGNGQNYEVGIYNGPVVITGNGGGIHVWSATGDIYGTWVGISGDVVIEGNTNGNIVIDGDKYVGGVGIVDPLTENSRLGFSTDRPREAIRKLSYSGYDADFDVLLGGNNLFSDNNDKELLIVDNKVWLAAPAASLALNKETTTISVNYSETLTATVTPDDATALAVTWTSSDESIATVDKNGKVTAKAEGVATITATTTDSGHLTASCEVTVYYQPVESITLNKSKTTLYYDTTYMMPGNLKTSDQLRATVTPADSSEKVVWSTSNSGVASVSNGWVYANGPGTAIITATCGDVSASCVVTVIAYPTGTADYYVGVGQDLDVSLYDMDAVMNADWWYWDGNLEYTTELVPEFTMDNSTPETAEAAVAGSEWDTVLRITGLEPGDTTLELNYSSGGYRYYNEVDPPVDPVDPVDPYDPADYDPWSDDTNPANSMSPYYRWEWDPTQGNWMNSTFDLYCWPAYVERYSDWQERTGNYYDPWSDDSNPANSMSMNYNYWNDPTNSSGYNYNPNFNLYNWPIYCGQFGDYSELAKASWPTVEHNGHWFSESGSYHEPVTMILNVHVIDLTLDKETMTLDAGDIGTLTATVQPEDHEIAWTSSNENVATVDANGNVTALKPGTATITAALVEDGTIEDSCAVTVSGFTVTFNTNGGSEIDPVGVKGGAKLVKPTDPTKDGVNFYGWFKDEALTEEWDFEQDTVTADITLYAKWTEGETAKVGKSISLDDSIGINVRIRDLSHADHPEYYRLNAVYNGETTVDGTLDELINTGLATYTDRYIVPVAASVAKEMTDPVHVVFSYVEDPENPVIISEFDYSVQTYCENTIGSTGKQGLRDLCIATLDYGAYAQQHFGYKTDNLANANYTAGEDVIQAVTVPEIYNISANSGNCTGILSAGKSTNLLSATELWIRFKPEDPDSIANYSFTVNGTPVQAAAESNRFIVKITGIAAPKLDTVFTVTVTNNSDNTTMTVTYSAMAYAYNMHTRTDSNGTVTKALYRYFDLAKAYFG